MESDERTTDIAVTGGPDITASLVANPARAFVSFTAEDAAAKAMLYNGMNNPDFRVANEIGQVIHVRDVFVEQVSVTNAETGEVQEAPRIVLFDADGRSHVAVSAGILNALRKLFQVFGKPTWTEPLPLLVKQVNTSPTRKMLTLEVAFPKPARK